MPRFFLAGSNMAGGVALLSESDAEHVKVLRMKLGDHLVVCDGEGNDHHCRLTRVGDKIAEVTVEETRRCPAEPDVRCIVLAGLPKGDRADYLVQKCTEAGAAEVVFFLCDRCVARIDSRSAEKKCARWQRIAEEAAKQAGRGIIPEVSVVMSFAEALDRAIKTELPLIMYESGETRVPLRAALEGREAFSSCAVITGPEGGFEKFEIDLAVAVGCVSCSMGERILRCETAPVVALSAIMYQTGNL